MIDAGWLFLLLPLATIGALVVAFVIYAIRSED